MILHCTFEELSAISAGAERVLAEAGSGATVVVAPPEIVADVEALLPRLNGDLSLTSLAEQQSIARAVTYIVAELKQRMDTAVRNDDADTYHLLNLQFHDTLVEYTGNRKLAEVYRKLVRELALFRRRNLTDGGQLPHSAGEHRQILKAIASGDPEAAGRAMFDHVIESKERMLDGEAARTAPTRARAGKKG